MTLATPSPPWWRGRWFVRLLTVRLVGQAGDGVFQGALASYALFAEDHATAGELAAAAAVVLLPWSLLGPYAGVLLDRWSRRQVLLLGNLVRASVLVLLAAAVLGALPDAAVYGGALVALGTNRFLLAGLSAALPHTVPTTRLTTANAVAPTAGTAAFVAGLGAAGLLRGGVLGPAALEEVLFLVAAVVYLAAGSLALRLPRPLLGPDDDAGHQPSGAAHLVAGLVDGLRHLRARPWPAGALAALGSMRLWFGLLTVSAVLSLRNGAVDEQSAVTALGGFTVATAVGFLTAAVTTPLLAGALTRRGAMTASLLVAAVAPLVATADAGTPAWWTAGALLGLGAQGLKICVDAVLQAGVEDDVRGRVFSLHDMAFNVAFVVAAVVASAVLPASGRSVPVLLVSAVGLAVTAVFVSRVGSRPGEASARPA